jgi:hypothetical protein
VAIGVGWGGEQKVPVSTKKPGWRDPDSKFLWDIQKQLPWSCFVLVSMSRNLFAVITCKNLLTLWSVVLFRIMLQAHKCQILLTILGIWWLPHPQYPSLDPWESKNSSSESLFYMVWLLTRWYKVVSLTCSVLKDPMQLKGFYLESFFFFFLIFRKSRPMFWSRWP